MESGDIEVTMPPADPDDGMQPIEFVQGSWVKGRFEGHFRFPTPADNTPPVMGNPDLGNIDIMRGLLFDIEPSAPAHYRELTRDHVQKRLLKKAWLALGAAPTGRPRVHEVHLRNLTFLDFSAEIIADHGPTCIGLIQGTVRAQVTSPRWPRFVWLLLTLVAAGLILSSPFWWRWLVYGWETWL